MRLRLAPIAVGALAFVVSVIGFTTPSVWYDEAATITSTTRTWPELWQMLGNVDTVHALYYFLMHALFDLVGYSPFALRLPSAIAVGIAAALVVVIGIQLRRARLGVIAGLVFCILPRVQWAGGEGRSYALTALAMVALTVVLLQAVRSTRRRWWIVYAVVAVLSCVLFIYLALVVVAHGVTVLVAYRASLARWATAAVVAAVVTAPFAVAVIAQSHQVEWISRAGPVTLQLVFVDQWFFTVPLAVVGFVLIGFGAVRGHARALILPGLIVPTVLLLATVLVGSPIYQPRYLTMCAPFVALAIAAGIEALPLRRLASPIAVVLVVALAIPALIANRGPEAKESSSWAAVAAYVASERANDGPDVTTAIVYGNVQRHPSASARVIAYAYPGAFAGTLDPTLAVPAGQTGWLWEIRAPLAGSLSNLRDADVTYLITSNARDLRPMTTFLMERAGWHLAAEQDFTGVHVLRYER